MNNSESMMTGGSSFTGANQFLSKVVVARSKNDIVIKNTMTSSIDPANNDK